MSIVCQHSLCIQAMLAADFEGWPGHIQADKLGAGAGDIDNLLA